MNINDELEERALQEFTKKCMPSVRRFLGGTPRKEGTAIPNAQGLARDFQYSTMCCFDLQAHVVFSVDASLHKRRRRGSHPDSRASNYS
jgi:hypothetical protein